MTITSPFHAQSTAASVITGHDLTGKTVLVTSRLKTPEQGAATSVWAAAGQELEGIGGRYLEDCQEAAPYEPSRESAEMPFHGYMPYALDPEQAERLWTLSQDLVGLVS